MKVTLPVRFALLSLVIAGIGIVGIAVFSYMDAGTLLRKQSVERVTGELTMRSNMFKENINRVRFDVLRISTSKPVTDYGRAVLNDGYDEETNMTAGLLIQRITNDFKLLMEQRPGYSKVRYISVEKGGEELINVVRTKGKLKIVPVEQLQHKGERPYYIETLKLKAGKQHISNVELNEENGVVVFPPQPVIRVAGPIFSTEGSILGIVVINVNFNEAARPFESSKGSPGFMLADEKGDYLFHEDQGRQFTFVTGGNAGFARDYPEAFSMKNSGDEFTFFDLPEQSASLICTNIFYDPVNKRKFIILAALVSDKVINEMTLGFGQRLGFGVIAVVILICVGMAMLSGSLLNPIEQLTQVAELIAGGGQAEIPSVNRNDELGSLAKAFQTMVNHLSSSNKSLQKQTEALIQSEEELKQTNDYLSMQSKELKEQKALLEAEKNEKEFQNTVLENAKKEIEKKAEELELISKYKSDFLANMSHELRTPLNSIILISQYMVQNGKKDLTEKYIKCASTINSSGTELLGLINEVLDLAKVEAGVMLIEPQEVLLSDLSDIMKRNFKPVVAEKGIDFNVNISSALPDTIESDPQRLSQIIKNLLSNAIKFTDKGGVTLEIRRPDPDMIEHGSLITSDKGIAFLVHDTGIGIPEDKQELVFQAFKQADGSTCRKYGGTGLGLSIAREFAYLLGGEISLKSRPGEGTVFILCLPEMIEDYSKNNELLLQGSTIDQEDVTKPVKSEQVDIPTEYVSDDRHELTPECRTILIIEDDVQFAKLLFNFAREKGFKVIVAESGETGLYLTDVYSPDGIILDMELPGIKGGEVILRLKDDLATRHIPIHVISASVDSIGPLKIGAVGYYEKPVTIENLNRALEKIDKTISKKINDVLLIEGEKGTQQFVRKYLESDITKLTTVSTGPEAEKLLEEKDFDCMIIDITLTGVSGLEILKNLRIQKGALPVIIYSPGDLTPDEKEICDELADSVVLKNTGSREALLDEMTLFLHNVEADLPEDKRKILKVIHDKEVVLANRKVLIVDDDMRNVFALIGILENKEIKTIIAKNGKEALTILSENPDIDLVLMDIMMPEMDGYEAMKEIRMMDSEINKVPVIALTAKAMKGDREKCIEAGANDYLSKPVDVDKLIAMLQVWLYRG